MRTVRTVKKSAAFAVILTAALFFYALFIEPNTLRDATVRLDIPDLPPALKGTKIFQLSDVHLGDHFSLARLSSIVEKANKLKPDIFVFTGDLMDKPNRYGDIHLIQKVLKKIKAPMGKFAVYGNHDHGGFGTDNYKKIMKESGFTLLVNEAQLLYSSKDYRFYAAGIDDAILGAPKCPVIPDNKKSHVLLLVHEPVLIKGGACSKTVLQLSGHSHGGQINLPFIEIPDLSHSSGNYKQGLYIKNGRYLYVSSGVGTARLPLRLFSPPEVTMFVLE
ncbi:metallophosphoesterase [Metabacillus sp. GX 13764]|uniref:metallophosphoesterase n=1 Tax=Metabacillus kandeliae TaxID=2900151 RepID=UPI001E2CD00C|nr:metallophosphoesterase [Metabacillus kandeliae]MCD7035462.1 metallophosphoesterase [Metabacillus kandeliae]